MAVAAVAAAGRLWSQIMGSTASSFYPRTLMGSLGLPNLLVGSRPLHHGLFPSQGSSGSRPVHVMKKKLGYHEPM